MSSVRIDPQIMSGTPCFADTRVPVQLLINLLAAGETVDDFLEGYPTVSPELVQDVLRLVGQQVATAAEHVARAGQPSSSAARSRARPIGRQYRALAMRSTPAPPRLRDLDLDARCELAAALHDLAADLTKLGGGAGFCEDRGFGWSIESEKGYRENIVAAFDRCPVLYRLMHDSGVLLATGQTIGDRPFALAEVAIARAALANRCVFEWNVGEHYAEMRHEITLGPVDVRVRADSLASTTGGQPFSASDHRYAYEAFADPELWSLRTQGIGDAHSALLAVFYRLRRYFLTCDACPAAAGSVGFADANTRVTSMSPLGPPASIAIDADDAARVHRALLESDFRILHDLDPALVPAYCPACDHVFCPSHATIGRAMSAAAGPIVCRCGQTRSR